MEVRIAVPADVPSMFDVRTSVLENHMSVEALARIGVTPDTVTTMLSGDGRGWVVEEDGKVVAFSMADAGKATVFAMFVRPRYEGKGLGRALMTEAERWLFSRDCEEIWLLTDRDPRVRANGFYQHLGLEERTHSGGRADSVYKAARGVAYLRGSDNPGARRQGCRRVIEGEPIA